MALTLLIIAIFQGIVFGFIILKSPVFKSNANTYLAYAIFSLSYSLINFALDDFTELYETSPLLLVIDILDPGIILPSFLFLFVIHQVNHPIKHSKKILWLFLIYPLSIVSDILSELEKLYEIPLFIKIFMIILELIIILLTLLIPVIFAYTYSFIKFSKTEQEKRWLTRLWFLAFIIFASWLFMLIIGLFLTNVSDYVKLIIPLFATFYIHWTAYFGIFKFRLAKDQEAIRALINKRKTEKINEVITETDQETINTNINQLKQNNANNTPNLSKKANTKKIESLTDENPYFKKLETLCKEDQIYRDSTLDRDKVASMLGISSGYVSQLVNTITGDNFSTYINRYRVESVKNIISDTEFDNYSLLAIGLECGFSSKTTFHNAFKKITGITPNAYRKMQK